MNELVCFVRQGDVARVTSLLASKATDINAVCPVTVRFVEPAGSPVAFAPHEGEGPLYPTHALFEASRSGHLEMLALLLSDPLLDVNARATRKGITALGDAAARGEAAIVSALLDHPRIQHTAGSEEVPSPLLYAIKYGHVAIVKELLRRNLVSVEEEAAAKAAARANGNADIIQALIDYFLTLKPLGELTTSEKVDKIRLEFSRADTNKNRIIELKELLVLSAALGTPLSDDEAAEALVAMDTDHDNKVSVEEVIAFWLGERVSY